LRLRVGPVQSITSVAYYDGSNVQKTLGTSVYQLFTDATWGRISGSPLCNKAGPGTYLAGPTR
jgi:hypothetical protein